MVANYLDLPLSRPPIPVEWYGMSHFYLWGADHPRFVSEVDEMRAHPPVLMYSEGYHGHVQNPIQWGPLVGTVDPVFGEYFTPGMGDYLSRGLADPTLVVDRWERLARYLAEIHPVTRPAPYGDFATQLYGNPRDRLGFWEFWDSWGRYEAPLGLGARPPDPSTWLRRLHDPAGFDGHVDPTSPYFTPPELSLFAGLAFAYGPKRCIYCHPSDPGRRNMPDGSCELVPGGACRYHRYSACPNTEGWQRWWRILIQKLAKVGFGIGFIDNCLFGPCWNSDCEAGFLHWLEDNYDPTLRSRFFTVTTSLLANHNFEYGWAQAGPGGPWGGPYVAAEDGATMVPDIESYGGLYAARVHGPGRFRFYPYPITGAPEAAREYELTVHYRTGGTAAAGLLVRLLEPGNPTVVDEPLPETAGWRAHRTWFSAGTSPIEVSVRLDGRGPIWLDEVWLSVPSDPALRHPRLVTGLATPEDNWYDQRSLREWASAQYWDSVVDEGLTSLRAWAREVDPNFELFTNSWYERHGSDYYLVERHPGDLGNEVARQDVGHPPGVYHPAPPGEPPRTLSEAEVTAEVLNTNIFDYKWAGSKRIPHAFAYHIHAFKGHADYLHNLASALLCHAEAAAFGGGAGIDLELWEGSYRPAYARAGTLGGLRSVGAAFFDFVRRHPFLYQGLRAHAEVGIAMHGLRYDAALAYRNQILELSQGLAARGVLWEVLTEERANLANFMRLKVVVLHAVERISEAEAHALLAFMRRGGTVIASGSDEGSVDPYGWYTRFYVGMRDEHFRLRAAQARAIWPPVRLSGSAVEIHPIGAGQLVNIPQGVLDVNDVVRLVEAGTGFPGGRRLGIFGDLTPRDTARLRVAAWESQDRIVLHLLNYEVALGVDEPDPVVRRDAFKIQVELLSGLPAPSEVRLYSPEVDGWTGPAEWRIHGRLLTVSIPGLRIYEVVEIR